MHQRELHSDTPTFAAALRAALREAPKVILVGEMRDRETIEIALTAAETGHLIPLKRGGRVALLEILKSTMRTRDYLERGEAEGKTLLEAMRDGELEGMQHFDGEIEKLVRQGAISFATGLLYATNAGNLRVQLADLPTEGEVSI